jgi:hypothetical protein
MTKTVRILQRMLEKLRKLFAPLNVHWETIARGSLITTFPLTPSLSPRERENPRASLLKPKRLRLLPNPSAGLPLPKGEGRGEGKGHPVPFRSIRLFPRCQTIVLLAAAILSNIGLSQEASDPTTVTGTWKWIFTMPDGTKVEPRVKLKQEGSKLTGTSRFREGFERAISDGKINRGEVSFAVVRERDGKKTTTRYKGIKTGDHIKGTIESDWNGAIQSYPWEAKRFTKDPTGSWEWSIPTRGRSNELKFTLTLARENEQLTGTLKSARGEFEIEKGTVKDGEISFTSVREVEEVTITSKYKGKVLGDLIKGTVEITGGQRGERRGVWEAKRID